MDEPLCGPWEGGLNRLIPQAAFGSSCRIHDEDYTTNPAGLSRREADRRFLSSMLSHAIAWWHYPLAYVYYTAVRLGGWSYWRGG